MDDSINTNDSTNIIENTTILQNSQIFQKHFGGFLFLTAILLTTGGKIITTLTNPNISYYGSLGIIPLLVLIPQTVGLFIIFFESRFKSGTKHSLRVLKFFRVCTIIIFVIVSINIPMAIHTMRTGGNWAALGAFYTLLYSVPNILFLIAFFRVVHSMINQLKQNEQKRLSGVLMLSICGIIYALLELLNVSLFASFVRNTLFDIVWAVHGWGDFGLFNVQWSMFGFIYLIGAILFVVVLNRFHREV